ncbi:hypothetical protein E4U40_005958 [Claviceps sp. LM458 group G5]|nr:hypothetical protein E4U40_005958 [Claviceps sp. LM458 group G5]
MDETYQPPQLPYFAPQSRLPIPIPSVQDIEREAEVFYERSACRVARYGNHFVIKYGQNVSLTEGENMLFVRHTQPLLAPEVFALFSVENAKGGRVNYIIMENVVGDRLDQVWDRLGTPEKCRIAGELRLQVEALRQIPAPGYFGCIGRRPFEEVMFWTRSSDGLNDGTINGPFETETELNEALTGRLRAGTRPIGNTHQQWLAVGDLIMIGMNISRGSWRNTQKSMYGTLSSGAIHNEILHGLVTLDVRGSSTRHR